MSRQSPVREALVRYLVAGLAAVVLVGLLGVWLARRAGEAEAIRDAKDQTQLFAHGSVEPAIEAGFLKGDPRALDAVDRVVEEGVVNDEGVVRVKIWDRSGRIVYSDQPSLIGSRYHLGPEDLAEFKGAKAHAEVSDLSKPENRYERQYGKLLEVYLPIETPGGLPLRYEAYYRSSFIYARGRRIFGEFAPAMLGGLLLLALIQLPLAWQLAKGVRAGPATTASGCSSVRSRHQTSSGGGSRATSTTGSSRISPRSRSRSSAAAEGAPPPYDAELREAAAETRHGIGQLRTLLVEIYPPELHRAGLEAALTDVLASASARGLETLSRSIRKPSSGATRRRSSSASRRRRFATRSSTPARNTCVSRCRRADGRARLEVDDDGRGFDPATAGGDGHFGLRAVEELVREAGGELRGRLGARQGRARLGRGRRVIRVLLVEDHGLVRAGLERLLATVEDVEVVGGAADGAEAIRLAAETKPDVVLMDLSMPNVDGIEATREIVAATPDAQVVVLTSVDRPRAHPGGARRGGGRLPAQGLGAGGADRRDPLRRARRVAALAEGRPDPAHRARRARAGPS